MAAALWIEWDDESDESGAARWGAPLTDAQIDAAVKAVTEVVGREPDTTT